MRIYLVIILVFTLLTSCDDTMTQLQRINERPTANFTFLENDISSVSDSVKFFSSLSKNNYNQDVTISDPEGNLKDVFFKISSGSGKVFSNGINTKRQLSINNSLGTDEIYSFNYRPEQLGYHEIQIFAQDELDEYDTLTIKLTVFENLSPVAALSVKPTRVVSRYEYTIDGSGSYDRDAKFGGEIVLYRFGINSQEIDLKKPKFPYVFGGEQIVNISLRVQDSNGQWSDPIEGLYSID
ncbi:MAG: hypothetical protein CMJ19_18630 [Phycisphaeraceae bacterium]|nr:hypothetical protein [Phycisphaeraceae bacterium]